MTCSGASNSFFQEARRVPSCNCGKNWSIFSNHSAQRILTSRSSVWAWMTRSPTISAREISSISSFARIGSVAWLMYCSRASSNWILFLSDNSMLIWSIPSVYSPIRSSGITTSSLILNALVCFAIAAVLARSNQNFLRASALTATKPSPTRRLAIRTTSLVAAATASSSSPAISPMSTILGKPLRLDFVEYPTAFR